MGECGGTTAMGRRCLIEQMMGGMYRTFHAESPKSEDEPES